MASANLRVRISADLADIKAGLGLLRGELAAVKKQAAAALPSLGGNSALAGVRRLRTEVGALAATYLSLSGAQVLASMADEATLLRGRVKQAKGDYEAILAVANATRSGLAATADLYARVELSTRGQIKNQSELLTLTKTVNQAVKLSFTGQQQGQAAVMQLGQALGSGNLGGDELKSLRENASRLAKAIADGIGVSIDKLRQLGKEGKLPTDLVIKALLNQSQVIQQEYSKIPLTIGDAFTILRNQFVDYIGTQDKATESSLKFAEAIKSFALDLPRYLDPLLQAITLLVKNLDVLIVYLGVRLAGVAIAAAAAGIAQLASGFSRLVAIITGASTATLTLRAALAALGGPVGIAIAVLAAGLYVLYQRTNEAKQAAEAHTEALRANEALSRNSAQAAYEEAKAKRAQAVATLEAAKAAVREAQARSVAANARANLIVGEGRANQSGQAAAGAAMAARAARDSLAAAEGRVDDWTKRWITLQLEIQQTEIAGAGAAAAATATASGNAEKARKAVKGIVDQAALARDEVATLLDALEELYARAGVSIADYYRQKLALQQADIDTQIRQQEVEARTATTTEQQTRALTEIAKLQRQRATLGTKAAQDQKTAEEALAKDLGDVQIRLFESEGKIAKARRVQLEEEFRGLIVRLQAEGDAAGVALVRKLINVEAAKGQLDEFEARMQQTMGRLQGRETSVSGQVDAGMMSPFEGERQLQAARGQSLAQLQQLRQDTVAYLATMSADDPQAQKVLDFLNQLDGNIGNVSVSMKRLATQMAQVAIGAVTQLFMDLVDGTKSASDALKDFVRNFVRGMAEIAARALATYLVLTLLDTAYPGLGKTVAAMMGVSYKHSGGIAGAGGQRRQIPISPLLLGMAPRYHSGGIAGLKPNEVMTVLQRGEEVLTRKDPRHRWNGGMESERGRTVFKTPVVVFGEQALANALQGRAGEEVTLTHVRSNWEALRYGVG